MRALDYIDSTIPPPPDLPKGPGGVIHFWAVLMPPEPTIKRAVAFVDGQNLFFAARRAFG